MWVLDLKLIITLNIDSHFNRASAKLYQLSLNSSSSTKSSEADGYGQCWSKPHKSRNWESWARNQEAQTWMWKPPLAERGFTSSEESTFEAEPLGSWAISDWVILDIWFVNCLIEIWIKVNVAPVLRLSSAFSLWLIWDHLKDDLHQVVNIHNQGFVVELTVLPMCMSCHDCGDWGLI